MSSSCEVVHNGWKVCPRSVKHQNSFATKHPIWRATNNFEIEQNAYRIPNPPTIQQILRPHLQGGVQHTRHLDWDILGAERLTPGRDRLVPLNMSLELHDNHCKLSAEFRHYTFRDDRCLSAGSRSIIQRRVLQMFAITEELLGRPLTWAGTLHCKQCKREFEMEP